MKSLYPPPPPPPHPAFLFLSASMTALSWQRLSLPLLQRRFVFSQSKGLRWVGGWGGYGGGGGQNCAQDERGRRGNRLDGENMGFIVPKSCVQTVCHSVRASGSTPLISKTGKMWGRCVSGWLSVVSVCVCVGGGGGGGGWPWHGVGTCRW